MYDELKNQINEAVTRVKGYKATILMLETDLQAKQNAIEENIQDLKELLAELDEAREQVSKQGEGLLKQESEIKQLTTDVNDRGVMIAQQEGKIKELELKLSAIPTNEQLTPTLTNVIALFRLWLKDWLRNGS
jgi:chromosome segregation ATPase